MTRLAIVAFDGFTDIDVFLHWDLLSRAKWIVPEKTADWTVHLVGHKMTHVSTAGLTIPMHGHIDDLGSYDAVVVCSGMETRVLMRDERYLKRLALNPSRQWIGSQCSGGLLLAAKGLLKGRTASIYPSANEELRAFGGEPVNKDFVVHDRIATAAGCLAGVKLSRWLLENLIDAEAAAACIASVSPVGDGLDFEAAA